MSKVEKKFENPIYLRVKDELDEVGTGMCLAKWTQVTLSLQIGHNHSCHHPRTHAISTAEIARNPSALHNTRYKKLRRKEMLQGSRPTECDYCWNVEDNSDRFSDRIFKSGESWSYPFLKDIVNSDWREDYNPKYVEVAFSNACNFKCTYCGPEFSSKWAEELKLHGPIKLVEGTSKDETVHAQHDLTSLVYKNREHNPYVEAFWEWFPAALPHLRHYRITGGEPLMSKDTFKSMRWLIDNPNTDMEFSVNSNLSVPDKLWNTFVELLTEMRDKKVVKKEMGDEINITELQK